jgi:hypothetical protein
LTGREHPVADDVEDVVGGRSKDEQVPLPGGDDDLERTSSLLATIDCEPLGLPLVLFIGKYCKVAAGSGMSDVYSVILPPIKTPRGSWISIRFRMAPLVQANSTWDAR